MGAFTTWPTRVWERGEHGWYSREATADDWERRKQWEAKMLEKALERKLVRAA